MPKLLLIVAGLMLVRLAVAVVRFVLLPGPARRHYPAVLWHRWRWRWLAANLRLSYPDRHRRSLRPRLPFGTSVKVVPDTGGLVKHRVPWVRFKADPCGWTVRVRLVPGISRPEVEKNAEHLANSWGCHRVGISQPKPGRLLLRAVRRDPLLVPVSPAVLPAFDGRHLTLGMDEWGQVRRVSLANISGSVIGGSPGAGKTTFGAAVAVQLAPSPVTQWYLLDGKNGGDWSGWAGRAIAYAGDELGQAQDVLEQAHSRMTSRLATVRADLGVRNAWKIGPSKDYPLIWVCVDECSSYLDLESAKALGRDVERQVRACRMLLTELLRKGRSVMFHTALFAQKATSTSIPTDIRDLAGLRLCFQVPTLEAGIAVLGEDLRRYESASPTMLQGEQYAGVCTARLATGADIYTRLRAPDITEDQADEVAQATAHLREGAVPAVVPDDVRELVG
jgi:DNA segregation ATPase FtsK/SpoIIIE, S-DNA-T family